MNCAGRIQLQLALPYKRQPAEHHLVRAYLDRGYRVVHLQRISDRESLVTLAPSAGAEPDPTGAPRA